jgi:hypothetical protein
MKKLGLLLLVIATPFTGFASAITIFNTGVDSFGTPLVNGAIDPHYTDTNIANSVFAENPHGAWVAPGSSAMYISLNAATQGDGVYTLDYVTTINLTGLDPTSVNITGLWSTDNTGNNIFVNGHGTGSTSPGFGALTGFTLLGSSGFFTSGINSLDFEWSNSGGPGGLLVEITSATANPAATGAPEPASLTLFGSALIGFAVFGRRRSARR